MLKFNKQFSEIVKLAEQARFNTYQSINSELVNLYWQIGEYISKKVANAEWGMNVVDKLAAYFQENASDLKGFDRRGLYRMKQFYEAYQNLESIEKSELPERKQIVSPLVTQLKKSVKKSKASKQKESVSIDTLSSIKNSLLAQITWSNHLLILSKTTTDEEKIFYIFLSAKEKYSKRELERQIDSSYYERVMLSKAKVSPLVTQFKNEMQQLFRDTYIFEFLNLPEQFSENDLKKGLVNNIKSFLLELGKDYSYIGEEYKMKVGKKDYSIDLLFFHRELCCLVAFELKINDFKPEYLGKLNFYLEALDRDVKKKHENPSVGILLCKQKDDEVVEFAMSRNMSPALVSKYKTKLLNKQLLKKRLHDFLLQDPNNTVLKKIKKSNPKKHKS
jgi:predicted nuclease of restriction endonuclease-like (RecB) superfamily